MNLSDYYMDAPLHEPPMMHERINKSFAERPSPESPEWESWWIKHHALCKIAEWYDTHREEVNWNDVYIAPPKLARAWIEVTYNEGTHFSIKTDARPNQVNILVKDLMEIFWVLSIGEGFGCPYIIQIDDACQCHLLSTVWKDGRTKPMDRILRNGKHEWTHTGKKKPKRKIEIEPDNIINDIGNAQPCRIMNI